MTSSLPLVLGPGLLCSARLYAPQIAALAPHGQVAVVDHRRNDGTAAVAAHILAVAPPRFALAGLSSGGYIVFAMVRQAPERIGKLALLNASGSADTLEQTSGRETLIAKAETGKMSEVVETLMLKFLHRTRHSEEALNCAVRDMAAGTGVEAFVRQERAIISRPDSRSLLASIAWPILVLAGDGDELAPPGLTQEIAGGIARRAFRDRAGSRTFVHRRAAGAVNAAVAEWLAGQG